MRKLEPDPTGKRVEEVYDSMKRVGYIEGKIDIKKQIDVSLYREALESLLKEEPNDPTWLKFRADYEKNNGAWS